MQICACLEGSQSGSSCHATGPNGNPCQICKGNESLHPRTLCITSAHMAVAVTSRRSIDSQQHDATPTTSWLQICIRKSVGFFPCIPPAVHSLTSAGLQGLLNLQAIWAIGTTGSRTCLHCQLPCQSLSTSEHSSHGAVSRRTRGGCWSCWLLSPMAL